METEMSAALVCLEPNIYEENVKFRGSFFGKNVRFYANFAEY